MRKRFAIVLASLVAALLAVGVVLWWYGWERPPDGEHVKAVAESFAVPADWELDRAVVRGQAPFCIDIECPSAAYRWVAAEPPSPTELRDAMLRSGWESIEVEGDCAPQPNQRGHITLCRGTAISNGLRIGASVTGPRGDAAAYWISVSVKEP